MELITLLCVQSNGENGEAAAVEANRPAATDLELGDAVQVKLQLLSLGFRVSYCTLSYYSLHHVRF